MSFLANLYRQAAATGTQKTAEETAVKTKTPNIKPSVKAGVRIPKILLVDDDPIFGAIMRRTAKDVKVDLTFCQSIAELGELRNLDFDVAVIDYDLGSVTGTELSEYLEKYAGQLPVVLVSNTQRANSETWSQLVKDFVHKKMGAKAIFKAAFTVSAGQATVVEARRQRAAGIH